MEQNTSMHDDIVAEFKEKKPQLKNAFDGVSLFLHSLMKRLGFTFLGCGDTNDEKANREAVAPQGWNASEDSYSFRYKHPKSSMTFIIKNLVMGSNLMIHGLGVEDGTVHMLQININEYINQGVSLDNYSSLFKDLQKLTSLFINSIVCKFFPQLLSEGAKQTQKSPNNDPLRVPDSGRRPGYQPYSPLMEGGPYGGPLFPQPPFSVGGDDLNPFGGSPFVTGPDTGRGNLVGPHHPGFGPRVNDPYAGQFPNGGRGTRPPPGARFDPFGPPPQGGFGEPDRDDFPPPGGPGFDYYL